MMNVQLYAAEVNASFNREKAQFRSDESTSRNLPSRELYFELRSKT
jgi:hypothetical protein